LVKVAIIQIKNLKIVAEKGFRRTLFEPELVDPNLEINFAKRIHSFNRSIQLNFSNKEREIIQIILYIYIRKLG